MVNDDIGHNARLLIRNGKVKKISDSLWEVGDEIVKKVTKPGRSFFTCSCESYRRNCASVRGSRCFHSEAVIIFDERFQKRIDKAIEIYENSEKLGITVDPIVMIQELKDLKYFK